MCEVPPCTLRRALTSYLDISSTPTRDIVREWIQYAEDDSDAEGLEKLSSDLTTYKNWKQKYPNVSTLFEMFPSLKVPAACLIGTLHKLKPRAYSVASIDPQFTFFGIKNIPVTDLMVEMLEYETGFKDNLQSDQCETRKGVCTSFLDRLPIGGKFLSYHHANAVFKMPDDSNASILMISAGSGIGKYQNDILALMFFPIRTFLSVKVFQLPSEHFGSKGFYLTCQSQKHGFTMAAAIYQKMFLMMKPEILCTDIQQCLGLMAKRRNMSNTF